jgi:polyisoprenoid-binding protein YceI
MSVKQWMLCAVVAGAAVSAIAADNYTVDPNHTYPSLEFSHMGLSIWRGKFNKTSGKVTLDRVAKTGNAQIQVETSSIDFGHPKMKEAAIGPEWLNVEKFPTMTYQGTIKFNGDTPAAVDGKLTLLGVTKPVLLKINSFKVRAASDIQERGLRSGCGRRYESRRLRHDAVQRRRGGQNPSAHSGGGAEG